MQADAGASGHPRRVLRLRRPGADRRRRLRLPPLLAPRQRPPHPHQRGGGDAATRSPTPTTASASSWTRAGGWTPSSMSHAVILVADHAQTDVDHELPVAAALGDRLAGAGAERRAPGARRARRQPHRPRGGRSTRWRVAEVASRSSPASATGCGSSRGSTSSPASTRRTAGARRRSSSATAPSSDSARDPRTTTSAGHGWDLEGDLAVLGARASDGRIASADYPDGLARLWSALNAPNAGDVLVSLADGLRVRRLGRRRAMRAAAATARSSPGTRWARSSSAGSSPE